VPANCERVVSDLFAAWSRLDLDGIMSHFADDAVWDNVPMNNPAKGKAAIRDLTQGFLKDTAGFDVKVSKCVQSGNVLFNERIDTVRTKNGKTIVLPVVGVFEVSDSGKISAWRDYFDMATLTKQS
jgi:limonene-1,2-epoxide hydrolase